MLRRDRRSLRHQGRSDDAPSIVFPPPQLPDNTACARGAIRRQGHPERLRLKSDLLRLHAPLLSIQLDTLRNELLLWTASEYLSLESFQPTKAVRVQPFARSMSSARSDNAAEGMMNHPISRRHPGPHERVMAAFLSWVKQEKELVAGWPDLPGDLVQRRRRHDSHASCIISELSHQLQTSGHDLS